MAAAATALFLLVTLPGCGSRERSNPLDPLNPDTGGKLPGLALRAGQDRVALRWDPLDLQPEPQVRIERHASGDTAFALLAAVPLLQLSYLDSTAASGIEYVYRTRIVTGSGALGVASVDTAGPGPEVAWVADAGRDRVLALAPDDRSIRLENGPFASPRDVAYDRVDRLVWLADTFDSALVVLNRAGDLQAIYRVPALPSVLAADPLRGGCWVADDRAGTVFRMDPNGSRSTPIVRDFAGPIGFAVDPADGGTWVVEADAGRLTRLGPDGSRILSAPGFDTPQGAAVDPGGAGRPPGVWVADFGSGQLARLTPDGREIFRLVGFEGVSDVAVDSADGSVWVTLTPGSGSQSGRLGAVARLDAAGIERWRVGGLANPVAVAENPRDQSVWVADAGGGAVWKIGPSGAPLQRLGNVGFPLGIDVDPGPSPVPLSPARPRRSLFPRF